MSAAHSGKGRQSRFHKDRFRRGGTRARAKRVREGLNVAACSSLAQGSPSLSPIRSRSHSHPLHANAPPLLAARPGGRFCRQVSFSKRTLARSGEAAPGLWPQRACWSRRAFRVQAGMGPAGGRSAHQLLAARARYFSLMASIDQRAHEVLADLRKRT
jgi:hypothetical protein